jgi:hypothetical protein
MIKITVKQLIDAGTMGALSRYFALEKPITVSWKNRKQVAACEEEINKHYNERRIDLCKKHGRLDEKTKEYVFTGEGVAPDAKENFEADLKKLWAEEIDLPGEQVSVSVLKGTPKAPLPNEADLRLLEPFLTD